MIRQQTGKQRVMQAMNFQPPDRLPRYWQDFWPEFQQNWTRQFGATDLHRHFGDDMRLVQPEESAWPSRIGIVRKEGEMNIVRTGWGELKRTTLDTSFAQIMGELLEPGVSDRVDPDTLVFDDPRLDSRFEKAGKRAAQLKEEHFVWCKSGGPYLRAAFMRGEEQFWLDVAEDPDWTRAFVNRVADHIAAVAIEGMKRFGLQETGIAIYDDACSSGGPFVGPKFYEQIFLPALRRMVKAYKDAGARWVMHHCDGNALPLLDMWIDAGIDAINPVEFRVGMDPVKIRQQYGRKLVCVGGLDNCAILPRGDRAEIRDHVLHLIEAGNDGGYVIGPHSIGPDISPATMQYVLQLLEDCGGQAPPTNPV